MRYLFTHLDGAWTLTLIHLRLSLIPVLIGLLIAVPLGALVQRTTTLRRLTTVTASIIAVLTSKSRITTALVAIATGLSRFGWLRWI